MTKGQVSLEYLMTYGIAIAIVVIAVGALYSMGVFSPGSSTSVPPCTPCFGDFSYNAHTYDGTFLKLEIKNGPGKINNLSCTASSDSASANCSVGSGTGPVDVNPNDVVTINIPGSGSDVDTNISFIKEESDLNITRTETISGSYFSK